MLTNIAESKRKISDPLKQAVSARFRSNVDSVI